MTLPTPDTLRDRVAAAIFHCRPDQVNESARLCADIAIAAVPRLSPEARETIRKALRAYAQRSDYTDHIAKARAELERLP